MERSYTCRNCGHAVAEPPCPVRDFVLRPRSCGKLSWVPAGKQARKKLKAAVEKGTRVE